MAMSAAETAENKGWRIAAVAASWLAILGIPLSLVSPGATLTMALVALYGVIIWARGARYPADLTFAGYYTIICYLGLVAVDFINGNGLANLQSTGINYLHLVAVAPFALALRRSGLVYKTFDRAMQVTIAIAFVAALTQFFLFSVMRPGGLFLNPIPYGFVLALWGVILLSRGLEQGSDGTVSIIFALAALVPVLLTESKISWACMLLGYVIVVVMWALAHGRWKSVLAVGAAAVPLLYLTFYFFAYRRLEPFLAAVDTFLDNGTVGADSFGWRYELATSGLRAWLDNPIFGWGFVEKMPIVFAHASPNGPDITMLPHLHNEYVTHLVSFGIPGLIFLLAFLYFLWRISVRCGNNAYGRAGVAITFMLALYMVFEVAFNMDPISGAVTVVFGLLLLEPQRAGNRYVRPFDAE